MEALICQLYNTFPFLLFYYFRRRPIHSYVGATSFPPKSVSACGYCRFHLGEPAFPLEETVVSTWGNCRSHVRKRAFPMGGELHVLILNMVSIYILAFRGVFFECGVIDGNRAMVKA